MKEKASKQPTLQKQFWFEKRGNEAENGKEERRLPNQKGSDIIKKGEGGRVFNGKCITLATESLTITPRASYVTEKKYNEKWEIDYLWN